MHNIFKHDNKQQAGFTLIELLIVVAVIGLMSSVLLVSLNTARARSRDAKRKAQMKQLQGALEAFFSDNSRYPCTGTFGSCTVGVNWISSEAGDNALVVSSPGNYIPGVTPNYIRTLPGDPKGGNSANAACSGWKSSYMYLSNGVDYALLSHCAPEGSWTSSDPFYDPTRPTAAWKISTPGARDW